MIAKRIRHVGILVGDMERAEKFYRELGFSKLSYGWEEWKGKWLQVSKMWLPNGGGVVELVRGPWKPHVSIEVDEFPFGAEVKCRDKGELTVCFVKDPSGNVVELVRKNL